MIFSRKGGSGGRHAAEEPRRSSDRSRRANSNRAEASDPTRGAGRHSEELLDGPNEIIEVSSAFGPYDIADAPDAERIDLGSLKIPTVAGVEVRVQANSEGVIQQVMLSTSESVLQLAVFAAPRSEGIWQQVRDRIRKSLFEEGVEVEETAGDYGRELRAQVRSEQGVADIRFIGIDGPRWMVRAVYQGRAAAEPETAGPLATCLRGLVVDRGKEAMPAEDALPLRLPRELAEQAQAAVEAQAAQESPSGHGPTHDAANGYDTNGYDTNGYDTNGHAPNGDVAQVGPYGDTGVNSAVAPPANGHPPTAGTPAQPQRRPSPRPRLPE